MIAGLIVPYESSGNRHRKILIASLIGAFTLNSATAVHMTMNRWGITTTSLLLLGGVFLNVGRVAGKPARAFGPLIFGVWVITYERVQDFQLSPWATVLLATVLMGSLLVAIDLIDRGLLMSAQHHWAGRELRAQLET